MALNCQSYEQRLSYNLLDVYQCLFENRDLRLFANKNSVQYIEVSAKHGTNIDEAFKRLTLQIAELKMPSLLKMYRRDTNNEFAFNYSTENTEHRPSIQVVDNSPSPLHADDETKQHRISRLFKKFKSDSTRANKHNLHHCSIL
ncbi:hypothetical protein GJ496_011696 [Pomphorhynchus laevis]|nr:hypothetical protein GJ496_011696 [Pomphorhynchus laevis]